VIVGGTLDPRAMVAVGAQAIEAYGRITADICFLGIWSIHATASISSGYYEEADLRRVLVQRADRVAGLASRDKLGTTAQFGIAPATALTHLVTEPDLPAETLDPFAELGLRVVR
jgi:DeoR/GlpR family transcriptional regulator of sugar metabolism